MHLILHSKQIGCSAPFGTSSVQHEWTPARRNASHSSPPLLVHSYSTISHFHCRSTPTSLPSYSNVTAVPPASGFPPPHRCTMAAHAPAPYGYPSAPYGQPSAPPAPPTSSSGAFPAALSAAPQGLAAFAAAAGEAPAAPGGGAFHLQSSKMLRVQVTSSVLVKVGAMVAYRGALSFNRTSARKQGVGRLLKKMVTGEGVSLTVAAGQGALYLADDAKNIILLQLSAGESISVSGSDVLAFQEGVSWDVRMVQGAGGMMSAGLSNVLLTGPGAVAITCHGDPLALSVGPGVDACVDPDAAVAWSGHLKPTLKTDISLRGVFGRGSGEAIQMAFASATPGFVVVQPYEEKSMQSDGTC